MRKRIYKYDIGDIIIYSEPYPALSCCCQGRSKPRRARITKRDNSHGSPNYGVTDHRFYVDEKHIIRRVSKGRSK